MNKKEIIITFYMFFIEYNKFSNSFTDLWHTKEAITKDYYDVHDRLNEFVKYYDLKLSEKDEEIRKLESQIHIYEFIFETILNPPFSNFSKQEAKIKLFSACQDMIDGEHMTKNCVIGNCVSDNFICRGYNHLMNDKYTESIPKDERCINLHSLRYPYQEGLIKRLEELGMENTDEICELKRQIEI